MDIRNIDWAAVIIRSAKGTAPTCKPNLAIVNGVAAVLPDVFERFAINSLRRACHFISQSIIECDYYQTLTEYASGDAYDTRTDLGFTAARDGDGRTNKGFGIFQNTGPYNQKRVLKQLLGLGFPVTQDVKQAKSVLTVPKYAAWAAGIWWNDNKMNAVADQDSTGSKASRAVNRGNWKSTKPANHEADRLRAFKATWKELQTPRLLKAVPRAVVATPVQSREAEAMASVVTALFPGREPVKGENIVSWGRPIDRTGMSPEEIARLDAGAAEMAESVRRDPEGLNQPAVLGQGYAGSAPSMPDGPAMDGGSPLNQGMEAPGMDAEEHQEQVAAGDTPDAAPASPNIPLPAEPVAPGMAPAMLQATQDRMRALHYFGVGTPDGEAGWKTVQGIAGFQAVHGLPVTGQLDQATVDMVWSPDAKEAPQPAERALTTVADMKGKSRIIDAAAGVKSASVVQVGTGALVAAGTAVVSGFQGAWEATASIREAFQDVPPMVWGLLAAAGVAVPAAYSWWKANRVQAARVEDQAKGKTL